MLRYRNLLVDIAKKKWIVSKDYPNYDSYKLSANRYIYLFEGKMMQTLGIVAFTHMTAKTDNLNIWQPAMKFTFMIFDKLGPVSRSGLWHNYIQS